MTRTFTTTEKEKIQEELGPISLAEFEKIQNVITCAERNGILVMKAATMFSLDEFPGFLTTRLAGGRNIHLKGGATSLRTLCGTMLKGKRQVGTDNASICTICAKVAQQKNTKKKL